MIIGIGCDITDIRRIKKVFDKFPQKFLERCFTSYERQVIQNLCSSRKHEFMAKRFAAKEAFVKALGLGLRNKTSWQDIEIKNTKIGQPFIEVSPKVAHYIKIYKSCDSNFQIDLSLSDEYPYAQAFVIISRK